MRSEIRGAVMAAAALIVACASESTPSPSPPPDAGAPVDAAPDVTRNEGPAPPAGITFHDEDPTDGRMKGLLRVIRAADETNVREYRISWATDATTPLRTLATVPKKGTDVTADLAGPIPAPATHLLAVTVDANGTLSSSVAVGPIDNL